MKITNRMPLALRMTLMLAGLGSIPAVMAFLSWYPGEITGFYPVVLVIILLFTIGGVLIYGSMAGYMPWYLWKKRINNGVTGSITVIDARNPAPASKTIESYIVGVLSAPGVTTCDIELIGSVPLKKQPHAGMTLPVLVDMANPRRFNILWAQVPDTRGTTSRPMTTAERAGITPARDAASADGSPGVQDASTSCSSPGEPQFPWSPGEADRLAQ